MPKTKKKPVSFLTALLIAIASFSGFIVTFGMSTSSGSHMFAAVTQAKDGEDDGGDSEDEDKDEDEDNDDDNGGDNETDKAEKEATKKAKEAAKQKAEWQREQLKRKTEMLRRSEVRRGEVEHQENETEDVKDDDSLENEGDDNTKHRSDAFEHMSKAVIDAEERIARAQADGIDTTKALATLAAAKERLANFEQSTAPMSQEDLKKSEREVRKLAYFAKHKDIKEASEISKDTDKIGKRIDQAKGKIVLYQSLGGDGATFTASLTALEGEFATLKENLAKGGQDQINALAQIDTLERKVKRLKSSVEQAIYALGGTDERYDDDYENEIEDVHEHLNDVAEIEGDEIGSQIRDIARAQRDSVNKVSGSVEAIDKRSRVLQLLIGTNKAEVSNLETEISANKARIEVLTQAANKIEDPEVKQILLDQITSLQGETSKLETFVSGQKDRVSAFGWLINLF